jgi:hypothetical protein
LLDQEQTDNNQDGASNDFSRAPESKANEQTKSTTNAAQRRKHIARIFMTFWRNIRPAVSRHIRHVWNKVVNGIRFADEHSGAITAVATGVIAVLTIFYVHYAGKQWDEMRNSRRPWVGMSERLTVKQPPSFTVIDGAMASLERHNKMVGVEFEVEGTIRNFGNTPARRQYEFFQMLQYGDIRYDYRESSCKFAEGQSTGINPYPDFPRIFEMFSSMPMPARAIFPNVELPIKSTRLTMGFFPEDKGQRRMPVPIWIVGCIVYQDPSGGVHHTKVLYSSVSPRTSEEEVAVYNPPFTWTPITEFVMEDSDAD